MKYKILSVGTMYLDINCQDFPCGDGLLPNQEVVGEKYSVVPGGSALNFARVCAAIELKPVFVGKAGTDILGKTLSGLVTEAGVASAFIESPDVATNIGINFIAENESSVMAVVGSANQSLQGREVEEQIEKYISDIEYLYLGGCFKLKALMPFYLEIAKKAKSHGVKVVLDHGRVTNKVSPEEIQIMRDLLPFIDFYLPSNDELLATWEVETVSEAIEKIRQVSDAVIVVKDAGNGAVGYFKDESVSMSVFPVKVIDTVGAGDSFNAGFIKAQDMKLNLEESLRFAAATAALKISQSDLPTLEKVEALMQT